MIRDSIAHPLPRRWIRNLAIIAYVDLLFFPYFQVIIVPFSLPLIFVGIVVMQRVRFPPQDKAILFLLAFFMVMSVTLGIFLPQSAPYAVENIKRIFQFLTSFLYLVFFYYAARHYAIENHLRIISIVFLAYFCTLLGWFFLDPEAVNAGLRQIYGRVTTSEEIALMHFRFAYLFTDPNTAGYFLLIAVMPWLVLYKRMTARVVVVALCIIVAVFVQSRGVLLALIMAILLWMLPFRWFLLRFRERDIRDILKLPVIATVVSVGLAMIVVKYFGDIEIYDLAIRRISNVEAYQHGGSRFDIWWSYMASLMPLPVGRGHMFDALVTGGRFYPHSDLLRLIYSYGFIAAGLFMWWVLRAGWRYPLLLIPALMAFMVNSMIDEQKLFALFLATLGVFLGLYERRRAFEHATAFSVGSVVRRKTTAPRRSK